MKNIHITTNLLKIEKELGNEQKYKVFYSSPTNELILLGENVQQLVFHGDVVTKLNDNSIVVRPMLAKILDIEYIEKAENIVISTVVVDNKN